MSAQSFTAQKLFLINETRRQFPYKEEVVSKEDNEKKAVKPAIKIGGKGIKIPGKK